MRMADISAMATAAGASPASPCRRGNPLGVKGAGEAGAIGACPAVMNAVVDALWHARRISHIDMPATPERVWRAIEQARRSHKPDKTP